MTDICKSGKMTSQDLTDFNLTYQISLSNRIQKKGDRIVLLVVMVLIFIFIFAVSRHKSIEDKTAFVIFFTIALSLLAFVLMKILRPLLKTVGWALKKSLIQWASKSSYKKNILFQLEYTLNIDSKGFDSKSEKTQISVPWEQIEKVFENERAFYFFYTKSAAFIVQKRFFDSPEEIEELMEMTKEHVPAEQIQFISLSKKSKKESRKNKK